MKQIWSLLLILGLSIPAMAQTKTAKAKAMKGGADPQAVIQSLWENFKNKNAKEFESGITSNAFMADSRGILDKDKIMNDLQSCTINSYSLSDFKQESVDRNAMVLTYRAKVDGSCGEQKLPAELIASDVLVKRGGQWKSLYHQETGLTVGQTQ